MRLLRQQQRLDQAEMAKKLELSVSQYSKIEVGIRSIGKKPLHILRNSFGVSTDWILYGKGSLPQISETEKAVPETQSNLEPSLIAALNKIARELDISFEAVAHCFYELVKKAKTGEIK